jgi:hypothetical protein
LNRSQGSRQVIVGINSLALDARGQPHICYFNSGEIKYATLANSEWKMQTIDFVNETFPELSIALDANESPSVLYTLPNSSHITCSIKYAALTFFGWKIQTIAMDMPLLHSVSKLALDSKGFPYVAYISEKYQNTGPNTIHLLGQNLNLLFWNGFYWQLQIIDSSQYGLNDSPPRLLLDSSDTPHICYYREPEINRTGGLIYTTWNGSAWNTHMLIANLTAIELGTLLLDSKGNLQVSYCLSTGYMYQPGGTLTFMKFKAPIPLREPLDSDLLESIVLIVVGTVILATYVYRRKTTAKF